VDGSRWLIVLHQEINTPKMKVRIQGNSLRFRLKQSELHLFREQGEVKEVTTFGPAVSNQLSFILQQTSSGNFSITYQSNTIILAVPQHICTKWTDTELVGFEESIQTGGGESIKILVEKDFKCLDRPDIVDEDAFPNPNLHC
jgi:hypothetical protein